jgi:predicted phage terminase large subunit-like protein
MKNTKFSAIKSKSYFKSRSNRTYIKFDAKKNAKQLASAKNNLLQFRSHGAKRPARSDLLILIQNQVQAQLAARKALRKRFDWYAHARFEQRLPLDPNWRTWLIMAGRGFGKTRTGAESVRRLVESGAAKNIGIIGKSMVEAASVMLHGESGLLNIFPAHERPIYKPSQQKVFFKNGAVATLFGGNTPERLRGPQFDLVWIDELAKFRNPDDLYDQVMMGLRLGKDPKCIITTTPRPIPLIEKLMKEDTTVTTRGSTFDNAANLAPSFLAQMQRSYASTRLGSQELYAELLTEKQGALWNRSIIRYKTPEDDNWRRIVIAIDPATTHHDKSDETGIMVAGIHEDGNVYVLEDLSGRLSPNDWGQRVTEAYWRYKADRVVAEVNKGGDLVERVVKSIDRQISYRAVRATRGKVVRAEPVASLYEQGKVYHSRPLTLLEQQICDYIPGKTSKSPDRMDALVWALTDLMLAGEASASPKVWHM